MSEQKPNYNEPWRNWTPTLDRDVYQNINFHLAIKVDGEDINIKEHVFDFLEEEANAKLKEILAFAQVCEYMALYDEYQEIIEGLTAIFLNPDSFTETAPGFDFAYDGRLIDIQYYVRDNESKDFDARHIFLLIDSDIGIYTDQMVKGRTDWNAPKTYWRNLVVNGVRIEQSEVDEKFIENYMNLVNRFPMNPLR